MKTFNPLLYFITDSTGLTEAEFLQKAEAAIEGGATLVQLREKEKSTRAYMQLAEKMHIITKKHGVPLIIDDRVDVALAIGAEGVHLGQSDMPVHTARQILGDTFIIGATAKTVPQAKEAFDAGADYLGVGAIYPTTTKVITVRTSPETLLDICRAVSLPVCAIGGLTKDNLDILRGVPISGICAVSAIMRSENPAVAAAELREAAGKLIESGVVK
ncbi:MAG: thiamine phosphate synthase [Clostridia bacterium]|nr:thiamine phosphate synthase [Oscillospiraceae bacterium]MBQ7032037.1 thiamine phosphate synthase [Clostridia bacterium]